MEESITYGEAVARIAEELHGRHSAVMSLPKRSAAERVLVLMQMENLLMDKESHSAAIAVIFGKTTEEAYDAVTDVLKELSGDKE